MRRSQTKQDRETKIQRRSSLPPPVAKHKLPPEGILSTEMAAPPPVLVLMDKTKKDQLFLDAAYNCDVEKLKMLAEIVDINAQDEIGNTALMHLVSACDIESTRFLLGKNADANISDKDGKTPLMIASEYGELEIAKLLIENKAEINAIDENDRSALDYAIKNKNNEVAEFLKEKGAWK